MQSLWLEDRHLSLRTDIPAPEPGPEQALLRLRLAGICATDLEMMRGYYPYTGILGHEFVAEVVQVNSPDPAQAAWLGRRVVGEINLTCGACAACRAGRSAHCEQRSVLGIARHHGAFAEYLTLPLRNLHLVPENVPDQAAVFTEPLAAALEIQQQGLVRPDERVLVVGAGRLGLLIAQTLALTGCDLAVVARRPEPKRLLERWGIASLAPTAVTPAGYDVVVEATGAAEGFALARQALRPRGTLVLKSTFAGEVSINLSALVVDEITLVGSRCGPFAPALRLLASGKVDPTLLVQAQFRLSQGLEALQKAAEPGVLKVLLQP